MAGFIAIGHELVVEKEDQFDFRVFHFFDRVIPASFHSFFRFMTIFGSVYFLLPAYLMLVGFFIWKKQKSIWLSALIVIVVSNLITFFSKLFYGRVRPDLLLFKKAVTYSFPIGHTISIVVFTAILISIVREYYWNRSAKIAIIIILILFALLVALSRIILHFHYSSDVLAGLCAGITCSLLYFWLLGKLDN